jgi:hypothetical protein
MDKQEKRIIILVAVSFFVFFLIYLPHYVNPYPMHVDEWHHIDQALKFRNGDYYLGSSSFELGFHVFLSCISFFANLILNYKFLPAIWGTLSALILFFITYKKTKSFRTGIFAMIFFASIKSNVNLLGLWFFTPLTFAIPFIFLFVYFYTEGVQKQNKKLILISLGIVLFLIPTHSISFLFALPFLITYTLVHYKYLLKEYKFFLIFLIIPIVGIFFYSMLFNIPFQESFLTLIKDLQFKHGWGIYEFKNSPLEIYSIAGYILAMVSFLVLLKPKNMKKSLPYVLWPLFLIVQIAIFRITDISYLSPYQRNVYYLAISLPFLSAIGLQYTIIKLQKITNDKKLKQVIAIGVIMIIFAFTFCSFIDIPRNVKLYKPVNEADYFAIKNLSELPRSKILAPSFVSVAIYPITQKHDIVAGIFQNSNFKKESRAFFKTTNCTKKQETIDKHNVNYIIYGKPINCSYELIYNETHDKSTNYIYKTS